MSEGRDVVLWQPPPKKNGRPSLYTPELAELICDRLAAGETLTSICVDEGMPKPMTVLGWCDRVPGFKSAYERARDLQMEAWVAETRAIADTPMFIEEATSTEVEETSSGPEGMTRKERREVRRGRREMVQHRQLQVDARLRVLGALMGSRDRQAAIRAQAQGAAVAGPSEGTIIKVMGGLPDD